MKVIIRTEIDVEVIEDQTAPSQAEIEASVASAVQEALEFTRDERGFVHPFDNALSLIDIESNAVSELADPPYVVVPHGSTVVLVLNRRTASLVADALDVINPDQVSVEETARELALDIQRKV